MSFDFVREENYGSYLVKVLYLTPYGKHINQYYFQSEDEVKILIDNLKKYVSAINDVDSIMSEKELMTKINENKDISENELNNFLSIFSNFDFNNDKVIGLSLEMNNNGLFRAYFEDNDGKSKRYILFLGKEYQKICSEYLK